MKKAFAGFLLGLTLWLVPHLSAQHETTGAPAQGVDCIIVNGHELRGKIELHMWGPDLSTNVYQDKDTGVWVVNFIPAPHEATK